MFLSHVLAVTMVRGTLYNQLVPVFTKNDLITSNFDNLDNVATTDHELLMFGTEYLLFHINHL
jgi:hypothetical protein